LAIKLRFLLSLLFISGLVFWYLFATFDANKWHHKAAEINKWHHKAAEIGFIKTQFNLGLKYALGEGITQADSACPDNKYALTVNATPPTSRIRIMNIKPKYQPGICLKPGKYDINVTHQNYHRYRKWITLKDTDVSVEVILRQVTD